MLGLDGWLKLRTEPELIDDVVDDASDEASEEGLVVEC